LHEILEKVGNGPMNRWLNFGGDLDMDPDPDPYRDTGKTCLGGGMHCPSASSFSYISRCVLNFTRAIGCGILRCISKEYS